MEVLGVFLLGFAYCAVNVFLQYQSAAAVLHIEIESDKKGKFQLFWDSDKEDYSEHNSYLAEITTSPMIFLINLPSLAQIDHFRVDPNNRKSVVVFNKFQLIFSDGKSVDLLPFLIKSKIRQQRQLDFIVDKKKDTLVVKTLSDDSYFEFLLPFFKCLHLEWKQNCLFLLIFTVVMTYTLNQNFLKGSKQNGILFIALPDRQYVNLLKIVAPISGKSPRMWQEIRGQKVVYKIELEGVESHFVVDLVQQITCNCPESFVCFQYNRPCEI